MDLKAHPSLESTNLVGESAQPLQGDADPYFSVTQNMPSGPVGYTKAGLPPESQGNEALTDTSNPLVEPRSSAELIEEIDIRLLHLQDIANDLSDDPMPIRNAFRLESAPETSSSTDSIANETSSKNFGKFSVNRSPEVVVQDNSGRFIAHPGSVIHIDGNEGYDYIDLSDRDVAHVSFGDSTITVVDANNSESFTIRYENISQALFANGHMIDLA